MPAKRFRIQKDRNSQSISVSEEENCFSYSGYFKKEFFVRLTFELKAEKSKSLLLSRMCRRKKQIASTNCATQINLFIRLSSIKVNAIENFESNSDFEHFRLVNDEIDVKQFGLNNKRTIRLNVFVCLSWYFTI